MTIVSVNQMESSINSTFTRYISNKSDPVAGQAVVGGFHSYWRSTGVPAAGTAPAEQTGTVTTLNTSSAGAVRFMQQTSPRTSYLTQLSASCSTSGVTVEIHDRLAQGGGFEGRSITTQTLTGFDLSTLSSSDNLATRIGDSNYSDVQWWVEWYTSTGGTASNLTINARYGDGTTGNLTVIALPANVRVSRMIPLNSLIPAADSGKYIRGIVSATMSADTGARGNFGIVATRYRAGIYIPRANEVFKSNWELTSMPEIYNSSHLFSICVPSTGTTIGNIRLDGIIAHG